MIRAKAESIFSKVKNVVQNKSETEKMLDEALSSKNWGASSTLLRDIAQKTYDYTEFPVIMKALWGAMNKPGKQWRKVFKSLELLEALIKNGAEQVVDEARGYKFRIRTLTDFTHYEDGVDRGQGVREKAKTLVELLGDNAKIREEREKARKIRDKLVGQGVGRVGGGIGGGLGFGSSSYSGASSIEAFRDDVSPYHDDPSTRKSARSRSGRKRNMHADTPSGLPTYNEDHGFESGPEEDAPEEPSGESEPEPEPQVTKRSSRSSSSRSGGKLKIKLSAPPNGSSTKKSAPRVQETFEDPFGTASSGAAEVDFDPFQESHTPAAPAPAPAPARAPVPSPAPAPVFQRAPAPAPAPAEVEFDPFGDTPAPSAPARPAAAAGTTAGASGGGDLMGLDFSAMTLEPTASPQRNTGGFSGEAEEFGDFTGSPSPAKPQAQEKNDPWGGLIDVSANALSGKGPKKTSQSEKRSGPSLNSMQPSQQSSGKPVMQSTSGPMGSMPMSGGMGSMAMSGPGMGMGGGPGMGMGGGPGMGMGGGPGMGRGGMGGPGMGMGGPGMGMGGGPGMGMGGGPGMGMGGPGMGMGGPGMGMGGPGMGMGGPGMGMGGPGMGGMGRGGPGMGGMGSPGMGGMGGYGAGMGGGYGQGMGGMGGMPPGTMGMGSNPYGGMR